MRLLLRIALSLFILSAMVIAWAFLVEPGMLKRRDETLARWPGPPLRIAFFSDVHAGAPHINHDYLKGLVERVNEANPDLILLGGDYVINGVIGGAHMPIAKVVTLLKELRASLGVFAVLGNHDWWNDGDHIRRTLEAGGIPVLENTSRKITMGDGFQFRLVGIGDDYTKHADPSTAFFGIGPDEAAIVFMHDPGALFLAKSKFFLAFAGHMHGGQIYVPGYGAIITPGRSPREWAQGWVDFPLGSLFISKGIGTSMIPVRLNSLPEFVIVELGK